MVGSSKYWTNDSIGVYYCRVEKLIFVGDDSVCYLIENYPCHHNPLLLENSNHTFAPLKNWRPDSKTLLSDPEEGEACPMLISTLLT